jgi:hypothetical protein
MRMLTKIVVRGSSFCTEAMTAQEAKRAFVTVLLALAAVYGLVLNITRDSADTELVTAFKRARRTQTRAVLSRTPRACMLPVRL